MKLEEYVKTLRRKRLRTLLVSKIRNDFHLISHKRHYQYEDVADLFIRMYDSGEFKELDIKDKE